MLLCADARSLPLAAGTVQCVVTSPPYWGLRDYGVAGQLGLEPTPDAYVANMVTVFREVWRVLRDDGVLFLNLGDSYTSGGRKERDPGRSKIHRAFEGDRFADGLRPPTPDGLKSKDLCGIPWRVAFALQADGWYLRSDIIWSKPNPMPESVTDRPTKAHEYIFLLTKNQRYFWDAAAVAEPVNGTAHGGASRPSTLSGGKGANGLTQTGGKNSSGLGLGWNSLTRNCRSVWTINTQPYHEAHFATFPEALAERCIKAGSKLGDLVFDPFTGSGTVGKVAHELNRRFVGTELNPAYLGLATRRMSGVQRSVLEVA